MGKKSSGKHYTSKGERPNVNKKIRNDVKANRDFSVRSIVQSSTMMSKEKRAIINAAETLYSQYKDKATWAACVQAVKTDSVPSFRNKYYDRGTAQKEKTKKAKA